MASDIDRIVDQIAERVQQRLGVLNTISTTSTTESVASTDHHDACHVCDSSGFCLTENEELVRELGRNGVVRFSSRMGIKAPSHDLAGMIDHTLLKPDATTAELRQICDEARQYHFATVCVNSVNIPFVARELNGSGVKPIAVIGFPLGAAITSAKVFETREAVRNGAKEIDMVINIGALKSADFSTVLSDIQAVVAAARPYLVKVILETSKLDHEQKVIACALSKAACAAYVKTSTGFGGGGATTEDIALMRRIVGENMGVKASGGIHSLADAEAMRAAGATRIGASASVAIVTGQTGEGY